MPDRRADRPSSPPSPAPPTGRRHRVPLVFRDGAERFSLFPVRHDALWKLYKQAEASFWTAEEVDLASDRFDELSAGERAFVETTLGFFAWADGVVQTNLMENFRNDVQIAEARTFFGFQIAMEGIHAETYSLLIEAYVPSERRASLHNALATMPCMAAKHDWMTKYMDASRAPFAARCVAFACVEGVFFSGAFASIFWLKKRTDVCVPGLTFSNELISRDEGLHCDFACALYLAMPPHDAVLSPDEAWELLRRWEEEQEEEAGGGPAVSSRTAAAPPSWLDRPVAPIDVARVRDEGGERALRDAFPSLEPSQRARVGDALVATCRLPPEEVKAIVREAVDVERCFLDDVLPVRLIGMSRDAMAEYMTFVADRLLGALGVEKVYEASNPFEWMELISLQGKTNFFEKRVGEYQKANVVSGGSRVVDLEVEF